MAAVGLWVANMFLPGACTCSESGVEMERNDICQHQMFLGMLEGKEMEGHHRGGRCLVFSLSSGEE